jgi:phage terminase Nu1 subunit (DNA packaging protein)
VSRTVNQKELAELLGLSARQIRNLDGMPRDGDGYPVPEAVRWFVSYREAIAQTKVAPSSLEESEKRLADAQAAMAELKLATMQGRLMTVEDYKRVRYDADQRVAARVKTLPTRSAPLLGGVPERGRGVDPAGARGA